MLAERWRRIEEIFRLAREKPPQERPGLLDALCQDDDELRREVERLLAAHAEAGSFLSAPVFAGSREPLEEREGIESASAQTAHDDPEVLDEGDAPLRSGSQRETISAGARIGPYRIVGEIGDGGMGAVYAAERADGQFDKRVAIKLVKRGLDTDEILERFRNERQILASLQHPNIAQLHDGGVTDDGRPFLVM